LDGGAGTATFVGPDDYSAAIGAARGDLFVTAGGSFDGRLAWLNLGELHLLRGRENLPHIGFFCVGFGRAIISFRARRESSLTYCEVSLHFGDFVFHGLGERSRQRTDGEGRRRDKQWRSASVLLPSVLLLQEPIARRAADTILTHRASRALVAVIQRPVTANRKPAPR
jgi:hypothetical protein